MANSGSDNLCNMCHLYPNYLKNNDKQDYQSHPVIVSKFIISLAGITAIYKFARVQLVILTLCLYEYLSNYFIGVFTLMGSNYQQDIDITTIIGVFIGKNLNKEKTIIIKLK